MAIFDNATSITIDNKEVASIKIGEATLYEKEDDESDDSVPSGSIGFKVTSDGIPLNQYRIHIFQIQDGYSTNEYYSGSGTDGLYLISDVPNGSYYVQTELNGDAIRMSIDGSAVNAMLPITIDGTKNLWNIQV